MKRNDNTKYDVIVIGAGAAGMMAAGQAASMGASVLILEKMRKPGRKLMITGKGRCNITNMSALDTFLSHINPDGRFLRQAFSQFFQQELLNFFTAQGLNVKVERGERVFPESDVAQDVVYALMRWIRDNDVQLETQTRVSKLMVVENRVVGLMADDAEYKAKTVIIATGGRSYPATGSTGDGYMLARDVGHTIVAPRPALVSLIADGDMAGKLQGLSLRNVNASVWLDGKKRCELFGELVFTDNGLSGPIILSLSRTVVDALADGQQVRVSLDLKPALNEQQLNLRLLRDLDHGGKKQYKSFLKGLLPSKLIPVCCEQTHIPADKLCHQLTAKERRRLLHWLKNVNFKITGHGRFKDAIITAGGVATREIDPRTMASRKIEGLYFAGEIIDLDADTGGYNLQIAFSTGWLAGKSAAQKINSLS